jgi:hypothetical protein
VAIPVTIVGDEGLVRGDRALQCVHSLVTLFLLYPPRNRRTEARLIPTRRAIADLLRPAAKE